MFDAHFFTCRHDVSNNELIPNGIDAQRPCDSLCSHDSHPTACGRWFSALSGAQPYPDPQEYAHLRRHDPTTCEHVGFDWLVNHQLLLSNSWLGQKTTCLPTKLVKNQTKPPSNSEPSSTSRTFPLARHGGLGVQSGTQSNGPALSDALNPRGRSSAATNLWSWYWLNGYELIYQSTSYTK